MDSLGLSACVDRHFPQPGNNRGLSPSVYVRTLILTRHTGAFRLDDVDRFQRDNKALLPMLGLERVPGAVAIGKWLRRMGAVENIQEALNEVNRVLLATSLRRLQAVMLEIDATEVWKRTRPTRNGPTRAIAGTCRWLATLPERTRWRRSISGAATRRRTRTTWRSSNGAKGRCRPAFG